MRSPGGTLTWFETPGGRWKASLESASVSQEHVNNKCTAVTAFSPAPHLVFDEWVALSAWISTVLSKHKCSRYRGSLCPANLFQRVSVAMDNQSHGRPRAEIPRRSWLRGRDVGESSKWLLRMIFQGWFYFWSECLVCDKYVSYNSFHTAQWQNKSPQQAQAAYGRVFAKDTGIWCSCLPCQNNWLGLNAVCWHWHWMFP